MLKESGGRRQAEGRRQKAEGRRQPEGFASFRFSSLLTRALGRPSQAYQLMLVSVVALPPRAITLSVGELTRTM